MRADELQHGERIRHPELNEIVTVDHVTVGLSYAKVHFRAHGERGWFKTHPHAELSEVP